MGQLQTKRRSAEMRSMLRICYGERRVPTPRTGDALLFRQHHAHYLIEPIAVEQISRAIVSHRAFAPAP